MDSGDIGQKFSVAHGSPQSECGEHRKEGLGMIIPEHLLHVSTARCVTYVTSLNSYPALCRLLPLSHRS